MITVYLGDVGEYLAKLALRLDSTASLVTQDNLNNLSPGTYYTSLGDLGSLENLATLLRQVNKIVYNPPRVWSDHVNGNSQMQTWTEDYLRIFSFNCQVENFSIPIPKDQHLILDLVDQRKTDNSQLWIAGCSISHGLGVTKSTRYGQLLADQLEKKVSFLTCPGSSITWAADQILRSDLRSGDIVVWGLTNYYRLPFYNNHSLLHVNLSNIIQIDQESKGKINLDDLDCENTLYRAIVSTCQVINFCQKIQVNLVIASLLDDDVVSYIKDFPNLIMLHRIWGRNTNSVILDLGSDGAHPGPKTHVFYAEQIYQKLQNSIVNI